MIYLDNASTTATDPRVIEFMQPYFFELYGNASGRYSLGFKSQKAIKDAREKAAALINAEPDEIVFTSGGTESNNTVLSKGLWDRIVTVKTEHKSVLKSAEACRTPNTSVEYLTPDSDGYISSGSVAEYLNTVGSKRILSVMMVNNETGTSQPVKELTQLAHEKGYLFHTDAVQAAGHTPIDVKELGVDFLSVSAHKFYGPKGIGFLYIKRGVKIPPFILGGEQERGMRSGTENVPAIAGLGEACGILLKELDKNCDKEKEIGRYLKERLSRIPGSKQNGTGDRILNYSFKGINGQSLAIRLDMEGICVSTGAACSSGKDERSHVLTAMGLIGEADSSLRISIGKNNTIEEAALASEKIEELVDELRQLNSFGE